MYKTAQAWIRTTVNISPDLYNLCKKNQIRFSEALRVGVGVMLAEKGEVAYDSQLNIFRRMHFFKKQVEENLKRIDELEKKAEKKE